MNVDELLERGHFDDNDTIKWAAKRITELEKAMRKVRRTAKYGLQPWSDTKAQLVTIIQTADKVKEKTS
jgi:hypothetical protein